MNINISVSGDVSGVAALADKIQAALPRALLSGAEAVAESARGMCPVRTGALQGSIGTSAGENQAVVYAGEDYGIFVEFGTYKMAAQPFLAPALAAAEDAVIAAITGGLGI